MLPTLFFNMRKGYFKHLGESIVLVCEVFTSGLRPFKLPGAAVLPLRKFARKFSNIDFFLQILPLKDDELVMSEI